MRLSSGLRSPRSVTSARLGACVLILFLNVLDVLTTHHLLGLGASEANPAARWLLANGALDTLKILAPVALAAVMPLAPPKRWITTGLWTVAGVYTVVVTINVVNLVRVG
jgi:hypothetical protein